MSCIHNTYFKRKMSPFCYWFKPLKMSMVIGVFFSHILCCYHFNIENITSGRLDCDCSIFTVNSRALWCSTDCFRDDIANIRSARILRCWTATISHLQKWNQNCTMLQTSKMSNLEEQALIYLLTSLTSKMICNWNVPTDKAYISFLCFENVLCNFVFLHLLYQICFSYLRFSLQYLLWKQSSKYLHSV